MTTSAHEQEVLEIEKRFWTAMKTKDPQEAARLTDDGCVVVGAQGVSTVDSETMGKLTAEGKWNLEQFTFDPKTTRVRFINDDVAIVAYTVDERVIVDGQTLPIKANDATVWVRRDGEWRCAMHTESLAGDPYGRDRGHHA
jgi:uncharacterized protein (TIGR02246 family)